MIMDVGHSGLADIPRIMLMLEHETQEKWDKRWLRKKSVKAKIEMARHQL